eukprot:UN23881
MHMSVIVSLDHSRFAFEVACKKTFIEFIFVLGAPTVEPSKKPFLKYQQATSNATLD